MAARFHGRTLQPPPPPVPADRQSTLDALPAQVALLDADGVVVAVNAAWRAFGERNGANPGNDVGARYLDVCTAATRAGSGDAARVADGIRAVLDGSATAFDHEYACGPPDTPRWFVVRVAPIAGGGSARALVQHQDVTARRSAEGLARFRARLLDAVDAAVIALDDDGRVVEWNHGAEQLYGWSGDEALGHPVEALVIPPTSREAARETMTRLRTRGRWEGEVELRHRDGRTLPVLARNVALEGVDGAPAGFVGVSIDITRRLETEQALRSARDYMAAVTASIGDGLCTLDEEGRVVYLNPRGEELLGWSAADLAGQVYHEAVHHTHGNGSAYLADDCPLVRAIRTGGAARTTDDVVIRRDGSALDVQQVLTPFETAAGVAGSVLVFSDITERKSREREAARRLQDLEWLERIRTALDEDGFVLHAQPIVDLADGRTVQHELLIRMRDADGSLIAPGAFLPVAEAYGLIGEIDRWVIGEAAAIAARGHPVELNLSASSLGDATLYAHVDAELQRTGADPALLVFELTETALLRDEEAAGRFVAALVARGCTLALDDFGTGYGGFSYLKRLPVSFLKIDIEFVRDLVSEPASRQVVEAVVSLARGFGIRTVAEGVEDAATLGVLKELGVDFAQGFHLGRPTPLDRTFDPGDPT
ncbi:MAG: hypothetical protein JWO90_239 [Solirubrobacterales bacterium]|nr:hypothetical protein [Solirubrobacterales bacterium]MCW3009835.1 hypothetical protein [Solirubrobacterales bacterium]